MGVLAPCDLILLEKGFESLDEANKALEELKKFDRKNKDLPIEQKINRRQKIRGWYSSALHESIEIFSKFGLTPSARASLTITPEEPKSERSS